METTNAAADSSWIDPNPQPGLYLFTESHFSNMLIMGTQPREPILPRPTLEQAFVAYDPFIADAGSFVRTDSTLTVRNIIAKVPDVMNFEMTYHYSLSGDSLTLRFTGGSAPQGGQTTYRLIRLADGSE